MQGTVKAMVIMPNQALRLRARKECTDGEGARRVTGEEWLVNKVGSYMPGAYEEVVGLVNAVVLTDKVHYSTTVSPSPRPLSTITQATGPIDTSRAQSSFSFAHSAILSPPLSCKHHYCSIDAFYAIMHIIIYIDHSSSHLSRLMSEANVCALY